MSRVLANVSVVSHLVDISQLLLFMQSVPNAARTCMVSSKARGSLAQQVGQNNDLMLFCGELRYGLIWRLRLGYLMGGVSIGEQHAKIFKHSVGGLGCDILGGQSLET